MLSGERPNRPVIDLGGRVSSLSLPAYLNLKTYLGYGHELTNETMTLLNTIGLFDKRILQHFDTPCRYLYLQPVSTFKLELAADGSYHDEWGVKFVPRSAYRERTGHPWPKPLWMTWQPFSGPIPTIPTRVIDLIECKESVSNPNTRSVS